MGQEAESGNGHQDWIDDLLRTRADGVRGEPPIPGYSIASAAAPVCGECGSPLSASSQFCWMCGAVRQSTTGRSDTTSAHVPAESGARFAAMSELASRDLPESSFPARETVLPHRKSASAGDDPQLFRQLYQKEIESADKDREDPEQRNRRRLNYRVIASAALLLVIVGLGYWQRQNGKAAYTWLATGLRHELADFWGGGEQPQTAERVSEPKESPTRPHAKPSRQRATVADAKVAHALRTEESAAPQALRVKVEGQPAPESSLVARSNTPPALQLKQVGVGISGNAINLVQPSPMRVEVAPRESLSLLLKQVPPVYPPKARAAGIEGKVVLKAIIRQDGNMGGLRVVSGNPALVAAAMDAVRQWVYRPYYRDGLPTEVETLVVVEFSLSSQHTALVNASSVDDAH